MPIQRNLSRGNLTKMSLAQMSVKATQLRLVELAELPQLLPVLDRPDQHDGEDGHRDGHALDPLDQQLARLMPTHWPGCSLGNGCLHSILHPKPPAALLQF